MKFRKSRNLLLFVILIIFFLQLIGLGFLFFCPVKTASAQVTPGGPTFTPQVDIPGSKFVKGSKQPINGLLIAKYIQAWYKFAVAAVGILAVVMIMAGGLFWLTAGGKADQISTGKDWIVSAVVGLVLALMSYTLLDILNPNLVTFQSLDIKEIELVESGLCCFSNKGQASAAEAKDCTKLGGTMCNVLQACRLDVIDNVEQYHCVNVEDGVTGCGDASACPEGWFCVNKKCYNGSTNDSCDMNALSCATGFYCAPNKDARLGYGSICYDGKEGDVCDADKKGQCNEPMCCIGGACGYDRAKGCCLPTGASCSGVVGGIWGRNDTCCVGKCNDNAGPGTGNSCTP